MLSDGSRPPFTTELVREVAGGLLAKPKLGKKRESLAVPAITAQEENLGERKGGAGTHRCAGMKSAGKEKRALRYGV